MNKYIAYSTFILLLIWSYFALQFFQDNPTLFTTVLLLLLEITSVVVIFLNIKSLFSSKLNIIIFIWLIYVILNTAVNSNDLFVDFRVAIWWPLIYFLFYFIAYNDNQNKYIQAIIKFFPFFFLVILLEYASIRTSTFFKYNGSGNLMFESSNAVFFNALLIPFAFLLKKNISKYIFLIIGLVLVLLSFKRSALIYSVLVIVMAMYYDFLGNKKSNIKSGILMSCLIITISFFSFKYIDNKTGGFITQRIELMQDDKGSGRSEIYKNVWKLFQNKDFEYKVIGSGQNSVIKDNVMRYKSGEIEHISAHNDFLEVLYDFGIIGLVLYLIIIIEVVKRLFYLKQIDEKFFQANFAAFIIFIVMSMVSHLIIFPNYFAYLVIIWAITEGLIERKSQLS